MTDTVKASNGYTLDSGRTEPQARAEIAAADRRSWFPGTRTLGKHGIISGKDQRTVAVFDRRTDRDAAVAMARAFDDMRAALERIVSKKGANEWGVFGAEITPADLEAARSALLKASGVRP